MKLYAVVDIVNGDEGNPGVKLFLTERAAEDEEQRLRNENPSTIDVDYLVAVVECDAPGISAGRDPAERINELLDANSTIVLRNQELSAQLREAQREIEAFRKMWHAAKDTQQVQKLGELMKHAPHPATWNVQAPTSRAKPKSISASDLVMFAKNTGELYEEHKRLAREKYTVSGWYKHCGKVVMPLFRKQFGPTALSFQQGMQAAAELRNYYNDHIKEV